MKFRTLLGHRMLHASRAFAWRATYSLRPDMEPSSQPMVSMEHALACEARTQFLPPHRLLALSPLHTRHVPEPPSPLGVGHTEDSQPGSHRPNRRLLKDWIAWTTLAGGRDVSSTFHRVTPAYGPCPKFFCLGTVYPFPSYHVERQVFETYCKSSDPVSNRAQSPD